MSTSTPPLARQRRRGIALSVCTQCAVLVARPTFPTVIGAITTTWLPAGPTAWPLYYPRADLIFLSVFAISACSWRCSLSILIVTRLVQARASMTDYHEPPNLWALTI
ncbi:hypothetical protein FA95DRAFT_1565309, partial [Auriscalpium vulgare]